jgi:hypothetical protein
VSPSHGEYRQEGAHEALTDHDDVAAGAAPRPPDHVEGGGPALLAGLLRCAGCRYIMRASTRRLAGRPHRARLPLPLRL